MRTTLTIEDRIAHDLKLIAHRAGKPFEVVVNETLEAGLAAGQAQPKRRRYRVWAVSLGGVRREIDLDKALGLAGSLEDAELVHKLKLRK